MQMFEEVLEHHRRFEHEPPAGPQCGADSAEELRIAAVVQVAKAVADAHGAVETGAPGQVAHVPPLPRHLF